MRSMLGLLTREPETDPVLRGVKRSSEDAALQGAASAHMRNARFWTWALETGCLGPAWPVAQSRGFQGGSGHSTPALSEDKMSLRLDGVPREGT